MVKIMNRDIDEESKVPAIIEKEELRLNRIARSCEETTRYQEKLNNRIPTCQDTANKEIARKKAEIESIKQKHIAKYSQMISEIEADQAQLNAIMTENEFLELEELESIRKIAERLAESKDLMANYMKVINNSSNYFKADGLMEDLALLSKISEDSEKLKQHFNQEIYKSHIKAKVNALEEQQIDIQLQEQQDSPAAAGEQSEYLAKKEELHIEVQAKLTGTDDGRPTFEQNIELMIPADIYNKGGVYNEKECCFCLEEYTHGEIIRRGRCCHMFHAKCLQPYLLRYGRSFRCPYDNIFLFDQ